MGASSIDMPRPDRVNSPAEFIASMRALRDWAQLTYRQLERRAHAAGDRLPRSTIATALSRNRIPRESTIASFVRACGGDQEAVEFWLAVRKRIAPEDRQPTGDENLAEAVEAWLQARAWTATGELAVLDRAAVDRTVAGVEQSIAAPAAEGAVESHTFAAGRLAQAVADAKGDRWVGVHRRAKPARTKRWRRSSNLG